jgi:hypothetical protein
VEVDYHHCLHTTASKMVDESLISTTGSDCC